MKNLFVLCLILNQTLQITEKQFETLHFSKDYFGKVEKVVYVSQNQICLVNSKGLKLINLNTQETVYQITQNIEQVQLVENKNLLVKSQNEILKFNTSTGKMIKKMKPRVEKFRQFIYVNEDYYFISKDTVFRQSSSGELIQRKFNVELNSIMYQSKLDSLLLSTEPDGKLVSLDKDLQKFQNLDISIRLFKQEDQFDSSKFILDREEKNENLQHLLNMVLFNQVEADQQYQIMKTKKGLEVINDQSEEILILSPQELQEQPLQMFTNGQIFIVQSKLLTLEIFRISDKKKLYQSEESMAEINNIVFYEQHDVREHLNEFLTYQQLLKEKQYLSAWRLRLKINMQIIKENFESFQTNFFVIVKNLLSLNIDNLKKLMNQKSSTLQTKIAVILTKCGKLLRFNVKTKKIENQLKLYKKDLVLSKEDEETFSLTQIKTNKKEYYDIHFNIKKNTSNNTTPEKIRYEFKIDKENNCLTGFYNKKETWQINLSKNEKILKYQTMQDKNIPQNSFVIEKNHVLYKLIDPNNFMMVTKLDKEIQVYIINLKYGKILGRYSVDINLQNFQLVVDDNSFFIIHYNNFQNVTEIIHFEIFRTKIEKELMPIIKTSWQGKNQKLQEIDYNAYDTQYILLQKIYGVDLILNKVFVFDSINDIASKNLLVLTKNNKLYSIPRNMLSTRRCLQSEKEKALKNIQRVNEKKIKRENYYKSQSLPEYNYTIPLTEQELISCNLDLKNVENLYVSPTVYESTSDLIATGQTFLVLQHSPNLSFDQLPKSFDKFKLISFIGLLIVVNVFLTIWQNGKAKYQNFSTD